MTDGKYPIHDRTSFFKYTSAATAIKILQSGSVLYRSPKQFNDPFDVQAGLHFDFNIHALPDRVLDEVERLASSNDQPAVSMEHDFGKTIHYIWKMKATHGFPRREIRTLMRPLLNDLKDELIVLQTRYQHHWWNDFLPRLRVFSVSETNNNILMWSHYAKDHTGVVFEFRVMPEQDNPLCVAAPVIYSRSPPPFLSETEWVEQIIHDREPDWNDLYYRYAYVKSGVWGYEKEWRVWDLLSEASSELCSPYSLRPDEIAAVYFGCNIDANDKATILKLLSAHPRATAFDSRKTADQFKLLFDPI